MTAPTESLGIDLDAQIANLQAKMTHGDRPLEDAIASLRELKRIRESKVPEPVATVHGKADAMLGISPSVIWHMYPPDGTKLYAPELAEMLAAARADYQWMVNRAADEHLDGYRELGAKCAAAEERADLAESRLKAVVEALGECLTFLRSDRHNKWSYIESGTQAEDLSITADHLAALLRSVGEE
jgi:hypothetical protein